jgi:hypothetical protein
MAASAVVVRRGKIVWEVLETTHADAARWLARSFTEALLSWPQAAMMSRPRGVLTGEA